MEKGRIATLGCVCASMCVWCVVHVCACVCVFSSRCKCLCRPTYKCMWKPEVKLRCCFSRGLYFETVSSIGWGGPSAPANSELVLGMHVATPCFKNILSTIWQFHTMSFLLAPPISLFNTSCPVLKKSTPNCAVTSGCEPHPAFMESELWSSSLHGSPTELPSCFLPL